MALKLKGSTSGFVALDSPAVAGNNTITLPDSNGSANAVWANDNTAGVTTYTQVTINRNGDIVTPGTLSIGGTITYEDVTNVDSVGLVTAAQGVRINGGGLSVIGITTGISLSGVLTATNDIGIGDSIFHIGDDNTAIRFPAVDTVSVETAGSERLRVISTGYVGIGTNDNGHITSPLTVDKGASNGAAMQLKNDDETAYSSAAEGHLNSALSLTSQTQSGQSDQSVGLTFSLIKSGQTNAISEIAGVRTGNGESATVFRTRNSSSGRVEHVRISSAGAVGIGTNSPDRRLEVMNDNAAAAKFGGGGGGSDYAIEIGQLASAGSPGFNATGSSAAMLFQVGGSEKARITSAGLFGINCTPSKQLQVKGLDVIARLESTAATGRNILEFYDSSASKGSIGYPSSGNDNFAIQQSEDADVYFTTNDIERVRIKNTGQTKFDKYGGTAGKGRIEFGNSGEQFIEGYDTGNAGSGSYLQFGHSSTTDLTIDNDGYVGINTGLSDIGNWLHVGLSALSEGNNRAILRTDNWADGNNAPGWSATGMQISNTANTNAGKHPIVYLKFAGRSPDLNGNHGSNAYMTWRADNGQQGSYGTGRIDFFQRNGAPFTFDGDPRTDAGYWQKSIMTMRSNGIVGVAVTNPTIESVAGTTANGMEISCDSWDVTDTSGCLKLSGRNNSGNPGAKTFTQLVHDGGSLAFRMNHNGTERFQIGSTGRINFSSAVASTPLSAPITDVYIENSTGQIGYNTSARKTKKNIADEPDISWIYNLQPRIFNRRIKLDDDTYSEEISPETVHGLIAEEVESVNSDFVFYKDWGNGEQEISGVHYTDLITPLIKAVQEQKKEIEILKSEVAALKSS